MRNRYSSEATAQLFSSLLQSGSLTTLVKLNVYESCDFSDDETCAILADFIDKAAQLHRFELHGQVSERKIKVELEVATEGEEGKPGSIKITDSETEQLVLQVDTQRTKEVDMIC